MDSGLITLVSATTAPVASLVGPLVTLTVARRQINASVPSANRQKWIETLREMLAELISLLVAVVVVKARWRDNWNGGMRALAAEPGLPTKLERIVLVQWKIRLRINPLEADHRELYRTIESTLERIKAEGPSDAETTADIEQITRLAQWVPKREWERVKKGT